MAKLITMSQSSLLLPQFQQPATLTRRGLSSVGFGGNTVSSLHKPVLPVRGPSLASLTCVISQHSPLVPRGGLNAIPILRASTSSLDQVELPQEVVSIQPDTTNGGGDEGNGKDGNSGGGGGGGEGDGDDNYKGDEGSSEEGDAKINKGISMSQKITLGYAALVGLGGVMGYMKSGSQKSLAAGGLSSLLLYYVYTQLPKRPVFASSIGLGLSAALLVVMGARFKRSRKVFPAGVVSLVSLVMTGGYVHGIMRTH